MNYYNLNINLLIILLITISSCQQDKKPVDSDPSIVVGNEFAERTFFDIATICDEAYDNVFNLSPAVVTIDSVSVPHVITIDFGLTDTYISSKSKYIRGKININYTGNYHDIGSVHTITFTDFYLSNNQVKGSKTITNNGPNDTGNLIYAVLDSGEIDDLYNNNITKIISNLTYEMIEGSNTYGSYDDAYLIRGNTTGKYPNNNSYESDYTSYISTPLERKIYSSFLSNGTVALKPSNKSLRKVDYHDGYGRAKMTIDGLAYNIMLKNY